MRHAKGTDSRRKREDKDIYHVLSTQEDVLLPHELEDGVAQVRRQLHLLPLGQHVTDHIVRLQRRFLICEAHTHTVRTSLEHDTYMTWGSVLYPH